MLKVIHAVKHIGIHMADPVAVQVEIFEAMQSMKGARANRLQLIVVEEKRAQLMQMT